LTLAGASEAERAAARARIAAVDACGHRVVAEVDGCRVVWRRFGQGKPLILLHGGHGGWLHWIRNVDVLAVHRTVWLPDMPGYLESDALPTTLPSKERFAGLVSTLIRGWHSIDEDGDAIDLAGFSFGGLVAAAWTAEDAAVRRLALFGASGHGTPRRPAAPLKDWKSAPDQVSLRVSLLHNLCVHMLHDPAAADAMAEEVHERVCLRTRFRSSDISRSDELVTLLKKIDRPTLLIWGEHDVTAYPYVVADRLRGSRPERSSRVIADAGHWVQYERADEINALLLDWLAQAH